jgi:hypothetical protein
MFGNILKEDDLKWKKTSNGRRPQMVNNLKWKTISFGKGPKKLM